MIHRPPPRRWRRVAPAAALVCLASAACSRPIGSGVLERHVDNDVHARARARWNDMRGSMKLQIAEQHLRAGRLSDAEGVLNEIFTIAPQHPDVLKLAVRVYLEQGRLARAREASELALAQPEPDAELEYLAGVIQLRYGEPEEALRHYRAACSLSPGTLAYLLAAAEALVALDRPGEALDLVEPRRAEFGDSPDLALLMARIHRSMGLRAPAVEACRRALRDVSPRSSQVLELADILLWAGIDDEAVALLRPAFDRAFAARPGLRSAEDAGGEFPPSLGLGLARAYLRMGNWREATHVLRPLMDRHPGDAAIRLLFARASLSGGDSSAARDALVDFHRGNPPTAESLLLLAYAQQRLGDHEAACRHAASALERDPREVAAWWIIGRSARALGRHQEAKDAFAHALAIDPDSRPTRDMLEDVLDEMAASTHKEPTP